MVSVTWGLSVTSSYSMSMFNSHTIHFGTIYVLGFMVIDEYTKTYRDPYSYCLVGVSAHDATNMQMKLYTGSFPYFGRGIETTSPLNCEGKKSRHKRGSTETRTRIFGFKVQGANHYTIEPVEREWIQIFINISQVILNLSQSGYLPTFEHLFRSLVFPKLADHVLAIPSRIIRTAAVLEKLCSSTVLNNHG